MGPSKGNEPKGQVQIVIGESTSEVPLGAVIAITGRVTSQTKKLEKDQKRKGKVRFGLQGKKPSPKCFFVWR